MWHGEGLVLDDWPKDWQDAREKAGLLWEPEIVPMFQKIGVEFVEVPDFRISRRDDTHQPLGPVTDTFALVYNRQMGEIVEAILGEGAKFETAGSLKNGAHVWCLVYLDEPMTVAGDDTPTYPFLAVQNAHDGSGSCSAMPTEVRIVCWNTYSLASLLGDRDGTKFTFRHTGNVSARIEDAKAAMSQLRGESAQWNEIAESLQKIRISDEQLLEFSEAFIDYPLGLVSDRVKENVEKSRRMVRWIFDESVTCEGHRGTGLGLLDAAVEYADHVRGFRSSDTYLGRTMLRPEPLKAKALTLVRKIGGA
jgi:phage/plasmid-like protein (TIGR03299 family)